MRVSSTPYPPPPWSPPPPDGGQYPSGWNPQQGWQQPPPPASQPPQAPVPPKRRKKRRKWPYITLVVLIVLLVAADRIAASVASTTAVKQLVKQSQGLGDSPTVSFGGFPFLTQVLFGKYSDIEVGIDDITLPEGPKVDHLTAHLKGAHIPLSKAMKDEIDRIPVDHVTATVSIDYAELNAYLKTQPGELVVSAGKDGAIAVKGAVVESGSRITFAGSGTLGSDDGQLTVIASDVHVTGTGFDDLVNLLGGLSELLPPIPVPLPELPFNLRITGGSGGPKGVQVSAAADHVVLDASQK